MYPKSEAELFEELREQRLAFRASCIGYDNGDRWEAKRLAAIAYMLLHDGGKSRSLLGQLRRKGTFASSKRGPESPLPLAIVQMSPLGGAWYQPLLAEHSTVLQWMKFSKWYAENILESGHLTLSRKNIIHTFRSQMGGSHIDGELKDEAFHWLKKVGPINITIDTPRDQVDDESLPDEIRHMYQAAAGRVPFGPEATMRQIAWEIEMSLEQLFPNL